MTYVLINAKLIITGQKNIYCANQIFYNLNSEIIGFILNIKDNLIRSDNKSIILKNINNNIYYDKMHKVIVSPLNITQKNIEEFKNLCL